MSIYPIDGKSKEDLNVQLDPDEARQALEGIAYRRVMRNAKGRYPWEGIEVLYGGKWLGLCRTDLYDDVATGKDMRGIADPIGYYKERAKAGARITDTRFSVIDAMSDG